MSAHSTREVDIKDAIAILADYKRVEMEKQLAHYTPKMLEEVLNYYAEDYPEVYILTNWKVKE